MLIVTDSPVRTLVALAATAPATSSILEMLTPWGDVGLVGALLSVVAYGVFAMASGRLIPVATHDRIVAARDAQLQQMTNLYEAERARGDLLAQQVSAGTEAARTSAAAMEALRGVVLPRETGGESP